MLKKWYTYGCIITLLVFTACKKKDSSCESEPVYYPYQFELNLTAEGQDYTLNSIYKDVNNRDSRVEALKLYIADLQLKHNNTWHNARSIELLDFKSNLKKDSFNFSVPVPSFDSVRFKIGVPLGLNGTGDPNFDPTVFGPEHPLNITNSGMYWAWNTGYRFVLFDGKVDLDNDQILETGVSIHLGTDAYLIEQKYASNGSLNFVLSLDSLFQTSTNTIDLSTENQFHGSGDFTLAQKFKENFEKCLSLSNN